MARLPSGEKKKVDRHRQPITPGHRVWMTYEAVALGYDDKAIARMVRSGDWHRLRHGAYCAGALWRESDDRTQRMLVAEAVYRSSRVPVMLSHTSALDRLEVPFWDLEEPVHVTRPDGRAGRREAGVAQHRGAVHAADVTRRGGFWITDGTRTGLDLTTIADAEHSLVVINALLHAGETTIPLLRQRLQSMVHWPETLTTDLVLRLADGRCESIGESRAWFLCWQQHLPMPIPQYEIRDRSGRVVARLDFAWPHQGVFMEFDGRVKYERHLRAGETSADAVIREKRREELVCGLTGWRCIRIGWADLHAPERTAARIRAALAGRPWAA